MGLANLTVNHFQGLDLFEAAQMFKNVKKRDGGTAEFDSSAIILAMEALALCKSLPNEATIQISSLCQCILGRTGEA